MFFLILCFTILGIFPVLCNLLSCLMCLLSLSKPLIKYWIWWNIGQRSKPLEIPFLSLSSLPHTALHPLNDTSGMFCPTINILTKWPSLRPALNSWYWIPFAPNRPSTLQSFKKEWSQYCDHIVMETQRGQLFVWSPGIRKDFSEVIMSELGLRISNAIINVDGVYKDNNNIVIPGPRESPVL